MRNVHGIFLYQKKYSSLRRCDSLTKKPGRPDYHANTVCKTDSLTRL